MAGWANLGAGWAVRQEKGLVFTDGHYRNFGMVPTLGLVQLIDIGPGHTDHIDYPRQWRSIAVSLGAFFASAPSSSAAALRFGYLQRGGPVARLVVDELRAYGFNAFQDLPNVEYEPSDERPQEVSIENLKVQAARWRSLCEGWPLGDLTRLPGNLDTLDFHRWTLQRSSVDPADRDEADEYHIKRYLLAALCGKNQTLLRVFEALINMYRLYIFKGDWLAALVVGRNARSLGEAFSKGMPKNIRVAIDEMASPDPRIAAKDKLALSLIPEREDLLHELWCADDIHAGTLRSSAEG